MSVLIFKETCIQLSTKEDCFLSDISHLILEVSSNGQMVDKINLFSRESSPGVWDADRILVLREIFAEFMVAVSMNLGGNESQLLGFMELDGSGLCTEVGEAYEIPMIRHEDYPNLILKAKVVRVNDNQELFSSIHKPNKLPDSVDTCKEVHANALTAREAYERDGALENLEHAIRQLQRAISMANEHDSLFPAISSDLGACLYYRFKRLENTEDLNDSIIHGSKAVSLCTDDDRNKPTYLSNLGVSLKTRFEWLGILSDIEDAIKSNQAAVNLTPDSHPNKPGHLSYLAQSLSVRFERIGRLVDIENAITALQAAVKLSPDDDPYKPLYLTSLGASLQNRFYRYGTISDIEDAITSHRAAVHLVPDSHLNKASFLSNLGTSLWDRFDRLGNISDIDDSIRSIEAAVEITPDDHPAKAIRLNNLALSLENRFHRLGDSADIDNAIVSSQTAVNLTPGDHPAKPVYLSTLGSSLQNRFDLFGKLSDIDRAIESHQKAVNPQADGRPSDPKYLNNLGSSLSSRFNRLGNVADLDEAIKSAQVAVDLIPDDHPNKSLYLNNLGTALSARYNRLENVIDNDNAIKALQNAVYLTPDGHQDKPKRLLNLGNSFSARFLHLGHHEDAQTAILNFSSSATSRIGPPNARFEAARTWSNLALLTTHPSLLASYECAITLMPLVAWLGLPLADRHQQLVNIGGIIRDAVAAAISFEQYDKALEWLEQGRSIVWTQILQLRTPVDEVRDVKPDLADRLVQVSRLLDQDLGRDDVLGGEQRSVEEKGRQYRAITMERESIIEEIRSVPNFENFLRPRNAVQLLKAAQDGAIIILNIAKQRCDALTLLPGLEDVVHIPLPNITSERISELGNELKDTLYSYGIRNRGDRAAKRVEDKLSGDCCGRILAELWNGLVKPILDSLAFSPHPDTLPHIWWCATGPLAFLPIHAAGIYDSDSPEEQLGNYAISSYIPSVSSLLEQPRSSIGSPFKLLSVIQSSAPGTTYIPSTKKELDCIRSRLTGRTHIVLEGAEGTKRRVMKEMEDSNWLHLACHGVQKLEEPTKSALILQDGHLTLEEIIRLNLPNAEFAFLSACQTTTGDEKLSEEAVHIAGGMLLAGYRGVVATMWSIQDELAPEVADEFYAHLTREGQQPDSRKAAEALHLSVKKLREKRNIPLTAWIPFVHLGV